MRSLRKVSRAELDASLLTAADMIRDMVCTVAMSTDMDQYIQFLRLLDKHICKQLQMVREE